MTRKINPIVTGVVKDMYGNALDAISVYYKNTPQTGTETFNGGTFSLPFNGNSDAIVIFSFQGVKIKKKVSEIKGEVFLDFTNSLDEVVITAPKKVNNTMLYAGLALVAIIGIMVYNQNK